MLKNLFRLLVIFFINAALKSQQETHRPEELLDEMILQIGQLELFLERSYWRDYSVNLLTDASQQENITDCSYVEDILSKNYSSGFMDIVISPQLKRTNIGHLGQLVRVIHQTQFNRGDFIVLHKINRGNSAHVVSANVKENVIFIDFDVLYNCHDTFYAEYCRNDGKVLMSARYYHEKPCWMWCMKDLIGPRIFGKLFIPGTHDSGSFIKPEWYQNEIALFEAYYGFVYTQEDSIFSQLMQGARYLDLRISKYKDHIVFYVNHNGFKVHPLKEILEQIKEFHLHNPQEIILMDIHHFPKGFLSQADHSHLANYLKSKLGNLICYHSDFPTWQVTMDELWKTPCRIIIAYNNFPAYVLNDFYPGVNQIWGDKDVLSELIVFMNTTLPRYCNRTTTEFTSAMVELTPKLSGIISDKYGGLRRLASTTNNLITYEFTVGPWGNAVQAVAVDFLSSTGIVNAAIRQNALRTRMEHVCH